MRVDNIPDAVFFGLAPNLWWCSGRGARIGVRTIFDAGTGFIHTSAGDCTAEELWLSVFWTVIVLEASIG